MKTFSVAMPVLARALLSGYWTYGSGRGAYTAGRRYSRPAPEERKSAGRILLWAMIGIAVALLIGFSVQAWLPTASGAPAGAAAAADDPDLVDVISDESIVAGLAENATSRVSAFLDAADARLKNLQLAVARRNGVAAEELARAYTLLLSDGIQVALADRFEDPQVLSDARHLARLRTRSHGAALAELEQRADEDVRPRIREAMGALRQIELR